MGSPSPSSRVVHPQAVPGRASAGSNA
jgi:hypothetical protein